tara:strand:- start:1505 stop:2287 length:783 start_codon:yes stop_codon:yes gene_type:complete
MAVPPPSGSKPIYYEVPSFDSIEEERKHRKERLAAGFRIFGKFGFSEGVAGHITVRDPEQTDAFWVNALGQPFSDISVSDLLLVSHTGEILEGNYAVNQAAFAIHSGIHMTHPEIDAAAHSHSLYGKAWSSLGRSLDPITQDSCIFYENHVLFDDYTGVVNDPEEGVRIAESLGSCRAAILRNHGLLTVGDSVDEAVWLFVTMERSCQAQLLAEAAGTPVVLDHETAAHTHKYVGNPFSSWLSAQPLFDRILQEHPNLVE